MNNAGQTVASLKLFLPRVAFCGSIIAKKTADLFLRGLVINSTSMLAPDAAYDAYVADAGITGNDNFDIIGTYCCHSDPCTNFSSVSGDYAPSSDGWATDTLMAGNSIRVPMPVILLCLVFFARVQRCFPHPFRYVQACFS